MLTVYLVGAAVLIISGIIAALVRTSKNTGQLEQVVKDEQVKSKHIEAALKEYDNVILLPDADAANELRDWTIK